MWLFNRSIIHLVIPVLCDRQESTDDHDLTEDPYDDVFNLDESNFAHPSFYKDPKNSVDKDPPSGDNSIEIDITDDHLSSLDNPFVGKGPKDSIGKDQPINDNSTENPSDDLCRLDNPFIGKDPKHKIGKDQPVD